MEQRDLRLVERQRAVVPAHELGGGGERVRLSQQRVGGRDRRLGDDQAAVHVAEVDHAHLAGRAERIAHDDVVVVGVAVDHAASQAGQRGHNLGRVSVEGALHERPARPVGDRAHLVADPARAREVPLQVRPFRRRVREVEEGPVHLAEQSAQAAEELRRVRPRLRERPARDVREHPHQAVDTGDPGAGDRGPGARAADAGQGQVWRPRGDVLQRRALHLDERAVAGGMHDLEDALALVGGDQMEVVVVLPRQRPRRGVEAEPVAGKI